jgi:Flp pilus assembly protein TadD
MTAAFRTMKRTDEAMDQFSAHLDRGWDLVQRGDTRGAQASAKQALELDPQSPEAYNLLGYVSALDGDAFEAAEHYRQAVALDDTYLEAMLNAAEVYIHPLGDFNEAIAMCEQALTLSETDEEVTDALLLTFDAMLGKGDLHGARAVILRAPSGPYDNPNHTFLVGRAFYEIGEVARAAPLIDEAANKDPMHAEAWYYLGLIRDERGDAHGATEAFLRAREIDLQEPPLPWSAPREIFSNAVQAARRALDPVFSRFIRTADIFVGEIPGIELVADGVDPRALLLLDGLTAPGEPGPPCSRIFVYQRNVERVAGDPDRLEQMIQDALEREITATFLEPSDGSGGDNHVN